MNKYLLESLKLERAVACGSFFCLLPYPKLLYFWAVTHPDDVASIARVASHRRVGHRFCRGQCEIIDGKMKKILVRLMIESLNLRKRTNGKLL